LQGGTRPLYAQGPPLLWAELKSGAMSMGLNSREFHMSLGPQLAPKMGGGEIGRKEKYTLREVERIIKWRTGPQNWCDVRPYVLANNFCRKKCRRVFCEEHDRRCSLPIHDWAWGTQLLDVIADRQPTSRDVT